MPDWTFQTVFRPLLFRLGAQTGRRVALGSMGRLSRLPLGRRVIQLLGHMQPDSRLAVERKGFHFPAAVGLGCVLDSDLAATGAFSEFGFGFLEIGPIAANPATNIGAIRLEPATESVRFERPLAALTPIAACDRLQQNGPFQQPVFARIEPSSPEEARQMVDLLGESVAGFVVPVDRLEFVRDLFSPCDEAASPRWICFAAMDANTWRDETQKDICTRAIRDGWLGGIVVVEAADEDGTVRIGKMGFAAGIETVRSVRAEVGPGPIVIGSASIHSPADALDYLEAGADLVQVDSGLVFSGPGLPKRIGEALLYRRLMTETDSKQPATRLGNEPWFWAMLMGLSMLIGGLMAMAVATTRVVLPYDESMVGLTREQLYEVNDRLLSFMAHKDRVTLAGTMLAVGILYMSMAWWGIRRGVHWAYVSVIVSALAGFFQFLFVSEFWIFRSLSCLCYRNPVSVFAANHTFSPATTAQHGDARAVERLALEDESMGPTVCLLSMEPSSPSRALSFPRLA